MSGPWGRLARTVGRVAVREAPRLLGEVQRVRRGSGGERSRPRAQPPSVEPPRSQGPRTAPRSVPTGSRGRAVAYAPQPDGRADPGEVVWTWVAYEEDASKGKDRPVLVVGRDGSTLLGLMLSSQAERDGQQGWLALGPGTWDREQRPSWVRLDRVLEVDEDGIRREGAVLGRERFDEVAGRLRGSYGWS